MAIQTIPDSYLNNNAAFTPIKTVGKKVNEVINSLNGSSTSDVVVNSITTTNQGVIGTTLTVGTGLVVTAGSISSPAISTSGNATVNGNLVLTKSFTSQTTNINTTVPLTTQAGTIFTVSSTLAAQASTSFSITYPGITNNSVIMINAFTNGAGIPVAAASNSSGTINIRLYNAHATAAFSSVVYINYIIVV